MGIKESFIHGMKKLGRGIKAKSPTILVVSGTIGLVAAGITAVIKTKDELQAVLDQHRKDVEALKDIRDGKILLDDGTTPEEYAEKKYKKHLTALYLSLVARLAKLYAIPLLMAALSITAILTGHGILNKWHLTAVAECYSVRETLEEYRKRVAAEVGSDKEKDIFFDRTKEILTEKALDENGEEKEESREVDMSKGPRLQYTYIVSPETMCGQFDFRWPANLEKQLSILLWNANDYMTRHGQMVLGDIMRHQWKDEYLVKHSEIYTDGWMHNNPLSSEPLADVSPITMDLNRISAPGEPLKYAVTFNAQGNIVKSLEVKKNQEKALRKMKRKVQARVAR